MSLRGQLQLIEQALRSGQRDLLPALNELFVASHPDAAVAWSDLAWLRMRSSKDESVQAAHEALALLQCALDIRPHCWQALDGLCEVQHRLGRAELARHAGRASLQAKHEAALLATPDVQPTPWPRRSATVEGELRVVAFSLFGREAFYAEAAVRNAYDVMRWYPGWLCRFYVGAEVSASVKQRLREAGAEVLMPPLAQAHLPGTVWRFLAMDDLRVKTALFRDADSLITQREALAVQQWLASDCQAHVMRDHALHSELILAGLWGAHTQHLRGLGTALLDFFSRPFHMTHADQHFLRDWIWPRIWSNVMQHDSVLGWHAAEMPQALDFPSPLEVGQNHVGDAPAQWLILNADGAAGTHMTCQLVDEQGKLLGEYVAQHGEQGLALRLPYHALQAIESGQWRLNINPPLCDLRA